ncbi:MAG: integration host factor subunit beta [Gammaproteobacteria bacterium]|jgi:integration host factor subunit beta
MNQSELIEQLIAKHRGLNPADVGLAVKTLVEILAQALSTGQRIEIRGFGSFNLRYRPSRTGRNPRTGTLVSISARYIPAFRAGKELRERVNRQLEIHSTTSRAKRYASD